MLASGLSAPTQNAAGIATATVAPAVSYEIGQYFKPTDQEGSLTHLLSHAILGATVAQTGGNNVLAGAISAGGAEAAAPAISQLLFGTNKPGELSAEEKETLSSITNLLGTATRMLCSQYNLYDRMLPYATFHVLLSTHFQTA